MREKGSSGALEEVRGVLPVDGSAAAGWSTLPEAGYGKRAVRKDPGRVTAGRE